MKHHYYILPIICLVFSSCDDHSANARIIALEAQANQMSALLQTQDATLKEYNSNNDAKLKAINSSLREMSSQHTSLVKEVMFPDPKFTMVDLRDKGFTWIDTSSGKLLIAFDDTVQFVDGYRIKFRLGNPSSATLSGIKVVFKYGVAAPSPIGGDLDNWSKGLKTKELTFTESLQPGAWTKLEAVIAPAKTEELGYVSLRIQADTAALRSP